MTNVELPPVVSLSLIAVAPTKTGQLARILPMWLAAPNSNYLSG